MLYRRVTSRNIGGGGGEALFLAMCSIVIQLSQAIHLIILRNIFYRESTWRSLNNIFNWLEGRPVSVVSYKDGFTRGCGEYPPDFPGGISIVVKIK
jgi:hypothetical protein